MRGVLFEAYAARKRAGGGTFTTKECPRTVLHRVLIWVAATLVRNRRCHRIRYVRTRVGVRSTRGDPSRPLCLKLRSMNYNVTCNVTGYNVIYNCHEDNTVVFGI
jgi:hypothetical protein